MLQDVVSRPSEVLDFPNSETGSVIDLGEFLWDDMRVTPAGKIFLRRGGKFFGVEAKQAFPIYHEPLYERGRDHWGADDFGRLYVRHAGVLKVITENSVHSLGHHAWYGWRVDGLGRIFVIRNTNELFRISLGGEEHSFGFHHRADWKNDFAGRVYLRRGKRFYRVADNGEEQLYCVHPADDWYIDGPGRLYIELKHELLRINHDGLELEPNSILWRFMVRPLLWPFGNEDVRYATRVKNCEGWRVDTKGTLFARRGNSFSLVSDDGTEHKIGRYECKYWHACTPGLVLYHKRRFSLVVVKRL